MQGCTSIMSAETPQAHESLPGEAIIRLNSENSKSIAQDQCKNKATFLILKNLPPFLFLSSFSFVNPKDQYGVIIHFYTFGISFLHYLCCYENMGLCGKFLYFFILNWRIQAGTHLCSHHPKHRWEGPHLYIYLALEYRALLWQENDYSVWYCNGGHRIHFPKPTECTRQRVNPNVNYSS